MSVDIRLDWQQENNCFDISFENNDFAIDNTVTSAVYSHCFTQRKLKDTERGDVSLQSGWVGNVYNDGFNLGTKIENIINQSSINDNSLALIRAEMKIPLEYLLSIGVVSDYQVNVVVDNKLGIIRLTVEINEIADNSITTEIEVMI